LVPVYVNCLGSSIGASTVSNRGAQLFRRKNNIKSRGSHLGNGYLQEFSLSLFSKADVFRGLELQFLSITDIPAKGLKSALP